jgi:hypothetical protein
MMGFQNRPLHSVDSEMQGRFFMPKGKISTLLRNRKYNRKKPEE